MEQDYGSFLQITFSLLVQNMAGEIFVHACHISKWAESCLVASQNIYLVNFRSSPTQKSCLLEVGRANKHTQNLAPPYRNWPPDYMKFGIFSSSFIFAYIKMLYKHNHFASNVSGLVLRWYRSDTLTYKFLND